MYCPRLPDEPMTKEKILCPELWNITYDDIFRIGAHLVGYADDVAARNVEEVKRKLESKELKLTTD